jgi:hypothetical protein
MGCSAIEEEVFVGKPEGGRPLARPRHKWEESINVDSSGSRRNQ